MPDPIKVMPTADDAIGLVHPVDGPLEATGSTWSYDVFTVRRLDEGAIRRFEADTDGAPKASASKKAATAAP